MFKPCYEENKGIIYSNRVRVGNWFEASKLEEVSNIVQLFKFFYIFKKSCSFRFCSTSSLHTHITYEWHQV